VSGDRRDVPAMVETATPVTTSTLHSSLAVPAMIAEACDGAARRFLEFFAASIRERQHPHGVLPGGLLVLRLARAARHRRA